MKNETINLNIKTRYLNYNILLKYLLIRQIESNNIIDNKDINEIQTIKFAFWQDGSTCLGWPILLGMINFGLGLFHFAGSLIPPAFQWVAKVRYYFINLLYYL